MSRLEDFTQDGDAFEELLYEAMDQASPGRAEEFCLDIEKKWQSFGLKMFMSDAQWDWLNRLAKNT